MRNGCGESAVPAGVLSCSPASEPRISWLGKNAARPSPVFRTRYAGAGDKLIVRPMSGRRTLRSAGRPAAACPARLRPGYARRGCGCPMCRAGPDRPEIRALPAGCTGPEMRPDKRHAKCPTTDSSGRPLRRCVPPGRTSELLRRKIRRTAAAAIRRAPFVGFLLPAVDRYDERFVDAAAQLAQFSVQMQHARAAGPLVQVVDVLRDHVHVEMIFQSANGLVTCVRTGIRAARAAGCCRTRRPFPGCGPVPRACRRPRCGICPTDRPRRGRWTGRCRRSRRRR